jgi:hypothetical protein
VWPNATPAGLYLAPDDYRSDHCFSPVQVGETHSNAIGNTTSRATKKIEYFFEKHPYRGHSRLPNSVIAVVS